VQFFFDGDTAPGTAKAECESFIFSLFYGQYGQVRLEDPLSARALTISSQLGLGREEGLFMALIFASAAVSELGEMLNRRPMNEFLILAAGIIGSDFSRIKRISAPSSRRALPGYGEYHLLDAEAPGWLPLMLSEGAGHIQPPEYAHCRLLAATEHRREYETSRIVWNGMAGAIEEEQICWFVDLR
jgi:hypothetical protein